MTDDDRRSRFNGKRAKKPGGLKTAPEKKALVLSMTKKRKLVHDARLLSLRLFPDMPPLAACLPHAICLKAVAAKRHGLVLIVQAGSCYWPRVREDLDDGGDTRFGYQWEPDSMPSKLSVALGGLPEIHVWLGDPAANCVVDPTTGTWPDRARESGLNWTAKRPPAFLWTDVEQFEQDQAHRAAPFRTVYHVQRDPTLLAVAVAEEHVYPKVAEALGIQANRNA